MKFKEREHVSKMDAKTEKIQFKSYAHPKCSYVGKVPKLFFENFTKKIISFWGLFVGKVPKSSAFNRDCSENDDSWKSKRVK